MKKYRNASQPLAQIFEPHNDTDSKTIPDQAMHVREILHRYTSGQSLDVGIGTPTYGNANLYDTRRKHNIDIAEDRHNLERHINDLNSDIYDKKTRLNQIEAEERQARNVKKGVEEISKSE